VGGFEFPAQRLGVVVTKVKASPGAAAAAIAVAGTFTWLGMVLAISFLEAPLKFRALA
jgi:hypothetical protein